jgi:hypothetical protein
LIVTSRRSGAVAAAVAAAWPEAASPEAAPVFGGEASLIEEERLDGVQSSAGLLLLLPMAAAIVIRTIKIAAQAPTMVAEFIQGAQSSEEALLCEAELRSAEGGLRLAPVVPVVDAGVGAGGKHGGRLRR